MEEPDAILEELDASAKALPGTQGLSGASSQKLNMDSLPGFPFIKVRCSFSLAGSQPFKGCLCPPRSFFLGDKEANPFPSSASFLLISSRLVSSCCFLKSISACSKLLALVSRLSSLCQGTTTGSWRHSFLNSRVERIACPPVSLCPWLSPM